MINAERYFRVGLILKDEIDMSNYCISIDGINYNIIINNSDNETNKFSDLIITDKEPNELTSIPNHQKDCHGSTIVMNKISNAYIEHQYEEMFSKSILKFKGINRNKITKNINSELIKFLVKENIIGSSYLFKSRYTCLDLIKKILKSCLLLLPFVLIFCYLETKYIYGLMGTPFSFFTWFVEYDPTFLTDNLKELKLLTLFYSLFNLTFYYFYIISIFENINSDIFALNRFKRINHKILQSLTGLLLFFSLVLILKELFVMKYNFSIASDYGFINIGAILNDKLFFLKDDYLIFYFFLLDFSLWILAKNFIKTSIFNSYSSNRQKNIINDAKKSFFISFICDFVILFWTYTIFSWSLSEPMSKIIIQLILLQSVYLYINIATIFNDFKYQ